jgi:hypothetical protein
VLLDEADRQAWREDHQAEGARCDPGAAEVCENGLDDDCAGDDGTCAPAGLDAAAARYTGEAAYDFAGWAVSGAGDVDGDGYGDALIGAFEAGDTDEGAAYLVLGEAEPTDRALRTADARYTGEFDGAGTAVAGAGDVDGDGFADVLLGGPTSGVGGRDAGVVWLVRGGEAPADAPLADADGIFVGVGDDGYAGYALAGAGDTDGDGFDDMLIGAYGIRRAYLLLGESSLDGGLLPTRAAATYDGDDVTGAFGGSVAGVRDVDGDGLDDVLVGAPTAVDATDEDAVAALFLGRGEPADGSVEDADALFIAAVNEGAGLAVAGAGDMDGDGLFDVAVGAWGHDAAATDAGAAFVLRGRAHPTDLRLTDADARFDGPDADASAGWSLAGAGDVDADGFDDLVIGGKQAEEQRGGAWLARGAASFSDADLGRAWAAWRGESADAELGYAVAGAGDVDADGYADVLLAAPFQDGAEGDEGAAYLILGTGE